MNYREMEEFLINNTTDEYYQKIVEFTFNSKLYKAEVNFAYINTRFDIIFTKHNIKYDSSYMLVDTMSYSNFKSYMDRIVRKLFYQNIEKTVADTIIMEMLRIVNKVINLFDSGRKLSLDISLTSIAMDMINNPELEEFFMKQYINDDMTPEEITEIKNNNEKKLKNLGVTGISDLLKSEAGIKPDQMLNIFSGLYMRTRVQDMSEIFSRIVKDRWIDGLSSKDNLFIETSINRKSVILNKIYIKAGGTMVKSTSQLVQDSEIVEDDCGTKHSVEYFIDSQKELNNFEFKYQILDDGSLHSITKNDTHLIGTKIRVRSLLKCASKYGVCATCFGSHDKWNRSTKYYKRDVGIEFKTPVAQASQKMLSVKHSATPTLIKFDYTLIDLGTGELIDNDNIKIFERKFNRLTFNDAEIMFDTADITNAHYKKDIKDEKSANKIKTSVIIYKDNEFGDWDIIRVSKLYINHNGKKYSLELNSDFKISGYPEFIVPTDPVMITLTENNKVEYVIKNVSATLLYDMVHALFGMHDVPLEEVIDQSKLALPTSHICVRELLVRNKIRDINDRRLKPDWKQDVALYRIETIANSIEAAPSISLKLGGGSIIKRTETVYYHDVDLMKPSSYDVLYTTEEDDIDDNQ